MAANSREAAKEKTRAKIISTALRLMAARGVDNVSLNEIVKASGQGNASALNYHFGNKAGLLQAIFDKYRPGIQQRRQRMMNSFGPNPGFEDIARAIILPMIEELDNPDQGPAYLKMLSKLDRHALDPSAAEDERYYPLMTELASLVSEKVSLMSPTERLLRMRTIRTLILHNLADYCYQIDEAPEKDAECR